MKYRAKGRRLGVLRAPQDGRVETGESAKIPIPAPSYTIDADGHRGIIGKNSIEGWLLLRPREAADALGLSRLLVYQMIQTGELPAVHIRGTVQVSVENRRAWIDQLKEGRENSGGQAGAPVKGGTSRVFSSR